jgi:hypothetical protein
MRIDFDVFELFAGTLGSSADDQEDQPRIERWLGDWSDGFD